MVKEGAARLDVPVERCAVVGDIGADVEAARAAGARASSCRPPSPAPRRSAAAPVVARDLAAAVDLLLRGRPW
jgi:beta-phosphoglucomutase-like phosphatase (HAD superfamily)